MTDAKRSNCLVISWREYVIFSETMMVSDLSRPFVFMKAHCYNNPRVNNVIPLEHPILIPCKSVFLVLFLNATYATEKKLEPVIYRIEVEHSHHCTTDSVQHRNGYMVQSNDEGYSRNASCALSLISTFLLLSVM